MAALEQTIEVKIRALVSGLREVQKLQTELKGIERAAGKKLSVNMSVTERALRFVRELSPAADGVINRLKGIEKASGSSFGNIVAGAGIAGTALFTFGSILYNVLQSLDKLAKESIEAGSRFHDLSVESGVSVETLSGLNSQLRQSGTDAETLSKGIFFLQKNLQSAADGNKQLRQTFAQLGIKDVNAALTDTEGTLRTVLKSLAAMTDEGKRNAAGAEVMGRGYESLRNFVADLNGDVDGAIEKSRRLGLVMSTEAAEGADRLGDQLQELKDRSEALRLKMGTELFPLMEDFFDTIGARLDRNAREFENWKDEASGSVRVVFGLLNLISGINHLVLGVTPEELDNARAERYAGVAVNKVEDALRKKGRGGSSAGSGGGKSRGGAKTKPGEPEDTFDSELGLERTRFERSFNLLKDALERENTEVEAKLKERRISIQSFYEEQERIQKDTVDGEIKKIGELAEVERKRFAHALEEIERKEKSHKLTTDQGNAKRIIEENKNKEASVKFEEQLVILSRTREEISARIARNEKEASDALSQVTSDFLDEVNQLNGRTSQVAIRAINERLQPLLDKIIQEEGEDSPLVKLLQGFIDFASDRARIDELIGRAGKFDAVFQARAAEVQTNVAQNVIAEERARRELNALMQEYADKQLVILRQALAIAEVNQDQEQIFNVRRRIAEIEKLKNAQQSFNQELKNTAINSAVDGLTNMFANIARDASNAKEYVRDFFASFLEELNRVIIRMLVMKTIMAVIGLLSGGGDVEGLSFDGFIDDAPTGLAEGDMVSATPGGRIIQVAEGGYDEVVLTTDPKHRGRTERLLAMFLSRTGLAAPFARGGFISGESILSSVTSRIPRLSAGDFISNLPEPAFAGAEGGFTQINNLKLPREDARRTRIPSKAAFRDAVRTLRGAKP
jgi:hypothetical protein